MTTAALSESRLRRMHDVIAGSVERGEVPGIVTLVARRDEVQVDAIGAKAIGGAPIEPLVSRGAIYAKAPFKG